MGKSRGARDSEVKRGNIGWPTRVAVWARCAGHCTICNRRLIGDTRTYFHSVLGGELAHNIGATDSSYSPRGDAKEIGDRETEENLLLLCHDCHRMIDHEDHVDLYPVEKLRALKQAHEHRIERVTANGGLTRTAVVRVGSNVRGTFTLASRREIGRVLITDDYLPLVEGEWSGDFTCEIRGDETDPSYWAAAEDRLNKIMRTLHQAIEQGDVEHVSVFAIAPIPVLIYLGAALDDKTATRIYPLGRGKDAAWGWDPKTPVTEFSIVDDDQGTDDVVLVCNVTAPVSVDRLPEELRIASRLELRPADGDFSPTRVTNEETLTNFAHAWRDLLARAERLNPKAIRWHVLAAVPAPVAVEIGRSFMRRAQPPVAVYQRDGESYTAVVEVNK